MASRISVPQSVQLEGLEDKWLARWESDQTYRFDPSVPAEAVYSIDTPPPTVSGSLHIGHVFSYTHADIIARYQRMQGKEVFYPVGFDDNGVPTERRVQNYFGVRCDPHLPFDPDFHPPQSPHSPQLPISRDNFIQLCTTLTAEDERVYESLWRHIGLSVDWSLAYTTVGERSRRISQTAFIRLATKGLLYQQESPTLWDVDFQTAVSQAELEDRPTAGAHHRIAFTTVDGDNIVIETSRPELIPACVALVAHPEDARYSHLVGTTVVSPLFRVPVPVITHPLAEPDKGTGIAMVCTFGDLTDVLWWRERNLPLRIIMGRDGRLRSDINFASDTFASIRPDEANTAYANLAGKRAAGARGEIIKLLDVSGALLAPPTPITHSVKFYEKGDRPLEIVASRQWYIRVLDARERLIERGRELSWFPSHMRIRYENWVEGLNTDWNISRQRFFGIPIPIWYPISNAGDLDYDHPIFPDESTLPLDPHRIAPPGYEPDQRDQPGGFSADLDVMDTWATSSLSPQIAGGWLDNSALFAKVYPMDLRPQGQDIIRTWLFYTMVRSELGFDSLPFKNALISGFVLDPDRKKMSKSKGNVVTPLPLVERFGADALRYWAAGGRPGVDTAADEGQMKVGRRLAIKIANATKFVLTPLNLPTPSEPARSTELDRAMLASLDATLQDATFALEGNDYTGALESIERFFWIFCDDYLELVKVRAYGTPSELELATTSASATASARLALEIGIELLLRAFAPFMPFVAEEAWAWWHEGSIHRNAWPQPSEGVRRYNEAIEHDHLSGNPIPQRELFDHARTLLGEIRRAKTAAKCSMKVPVSLLQVCADANSLAWIGHYLSDLAGAGVVENLELTEGEASVSVTLSPATTP
ncbi:MAG: valine--tRNA ligase [Ferrimicrobium sp.]